MSHLHQKLLAGALALMLLLGVTAYTVPVPAPGTAHPDQAFIYYD